MNIDYTKEKKKEMTDGGEEDGFLYKKIGKNFNVFVNYD
jgi:hypothetical protein